MKATFGTRGLAALVMSTAVLVGLSAGAASAASPNAVTKTFSYIGTANGRARTIVNVDGLLINARCNGQGNPVIFAFSSSSSADLFGRFFDGLGRLHIIKNSSFTKQTKGESLGTTSGDFDASGNVLFETYAGKVVSVAYAFDDSTTLAKRDVCTVYGSYVAT